MERILRSPWLRFALLLGVTVAGVAVFVDSFDTGALLARFVSADAVYVAAAVAVYAVSWPVRGYRYARLLRAMGHACRTSALTGAVFVSQTSNLVFPARAGDGTRAYVVRKRNGVPYTSGAASLAAERVLDLVAVVALGAAGLPLVLSHTSASVGFGATRHPAVVGAAGVAACAVLVAATVYVSRGRLRRFGSVERDGLLGRVTDAAAGFVSEFGRVLDDANRAELVTLSLVIWLLDVATCVAVFYSLGVVFEGVVGVALLAVSVGNLAKVVPATPGGVGLYEAGFSAVVVASTPVAWEVALAVAVFDHAIKNGVTVVGGVTSALALNVSLARPSEK